MSGNSNVTILKEFKDKDAWSSQLHDELYAIINDPKYDDMRLSTTIGVLEFLKWNLINNAI